MTDRKDSSTPSPSERFRLVNGNRIGPGQTAEAEDLVLGRKVRIRRLTESEVRDHHFQSRLQALSRRDHPNLPSIFAFERESDEPFLVLESISGLGLDDPRTLRGLSRGRALEVAKQLARALDGIHEHGLAHGAVLPENLIEIRDGSFRLVGCRFLGEAEQSADLDGWAAIIQNLLDRSAPSERRDPGDSSGSLSTTLATLLQAFRPGGESSGDEPPSNGRELRRRLDEAVARRAVRVEARKNPRLPVPISRFIGRSAELRRLEEWPWSERLVTLTGFGGSGKTRIALELAHRHPERYADGIHWVDLSPIPPGGEVVPTLLEATDAPPNPSLSPEDRLRSALQDQRALLILDNCEHVLDAVAAWVSSNLPKLPGLSVLATSRHPLDLGGEQVLTLSTLETESAAEDQAAEAVDLFLDRAKAADPEFQPSDADRRMVAEICRELDGLPLAIELAAARLRVLSVSELSERLRTPFGILRARRTPQQKHHRALGPLIDWSHDLLSEDQRILLRRLSVFSGGWTLGAMEEVCAFDPLDPWDVVDHLSALVSHSLVVVDARAEADTGERRYRLLVSIRRYAHEKSDDAGETSGLLERHAQYFFELAGRARAGLFGAKHAQWMERHDVELSNFRAALRIGETHPGLRETALRLATRLATYWNVRGHWREGRDVLTALLEGTQADPSDHAEALNWLGNLCYSLGEHGRALELHKESLSLRRECGDEAGVAASLSNLGRICIGRGDAEDALAFFEESLEIRERIDDRVGLSISLTAMGITKRALGDLAAARSFHDRAAEVARELEDDSGVGSALCNLANIDEVEGNYPSARSLYEEALALAKKSGSVAGICGVGCNLAGSCFEVGDNDAAEAQIREVHELAKRLGFTRVLVNAEQVHAWIAFSREDFGEARTWLESALAQSDPLEDMEQLVGLRHDIAATLHRLEDPQELGRRIGEAVDLIEGVEHMRTGALTRLLLAVAEWLRLDGQNDRARAVLAQWKEAAGGSTLVRIDRIRTEFLEAALDTTIEAELGSADGGNGQAESLPSLDDFEGWKALIQSLA